MVIDGYVLLGYAVVWTIFYWFLSQYIAELSRQKWTRWVQSEESDTVLLEALEAIIQEIEDRMHDKLQDFQNSFFGSIGKMTANAKNLDPMNNLRKAAKSGDWPSMMLEYMANKSGLGNVLQGVSSPKEGETNIKPAIPRSFKDLK